MSKPIIWIVVVIAIAGAGAGAYRYFGHDEPPSSASSHPPASAVPSSPPEAKPAPDHGNFQKRFQPSLPPSK